MISTSATGRMRLLGAVGTIGIVMALSATPAAAQAAPDQPGAAGGPAAAATPAEADQGGLGEIVVTAQRRAENLQDVPISINAVSAAALERSGVTSTLQIGQVVPAVQITRSGPSTILFMRGVGNSSGSPGEEGANAFYIDGVYLGDQSSVNLDFNNIERIEVLKGPQGTLFGRNSSGGLIHIITREPGDTTVVKALAGYGNYDTLRGQLYAATPLTGNLSADIALTGSHQGDGWGTNLFNGKDAMKGWFFGARTKFVWRPGADTKITATGDIRRSRDSVGNAFPIRKGSFTPTGLGYYGDYNTNTNLGDAALLKNWGASLTIEQDLGGVTLTSVSAHRYTRVYSTVDTDSSPLPITDVDINSSTRTVQQEFRLASNGSGPLTWQAGLFYFYSDANNLGQTVTGTALGGVGRGFRLVAGMKTNSYAAFGEVTYDITETTHLTGGLRYTIDDRAYTGIQLPVNQTIPAFVNAFTITAPGGAPFRDSQKFKKPTYRIALRQELGDDVNVYGSYNRGFKAGLYGLTASPRFQQITPATTPGLPPTIVNLPQIPVRPQTIDAFDAGVKTELFDRMLRLNLSAFHYKIKGYQVRAADPAGGNISRLLNATSVTSKGIEAEAELAPTRELRLFGNVSYLDSRFGNFPNYPYSVPNPRTCVPNVNPPYVITGPRTGGNNSAPCIGPATGNRTANSPEWAFNVGANYTADLGGDSQLIGSVLYTYKSRIFFDTTNRTDQGGYGLLNGSIEYRPRRNLGIEFFANNITDKTYYVLTLEGSVDQAGFGAPRTYGVNVKVDF